MMIAFDLDNTLLDSAACAFPESALLALKKLRKRHKIILATGRDMDTKYSRIYLEDVAPDGIVHMNGTKLSVGDKLLLRHVMDRSFVREMLEFGKKRGLAVGFSKGDYDYFTSPELVEKLDTAYLGKCYRNFRDPMEILDMECSSMTIRGYQEMIDEMAGHFPNLDFLPFGGYQGADIVEKGFSKADGLRRLAAYFGEPEDLSTTVAFGDSMNDMDMIRAAGIGVAMGNAVQPLKDEADYITTGVREDGIYRACEHLGLF